MNAILAEAQAQACTSAEEVSTAAPVTEAVPTNETQQEADHGEQGWLARIRGIVRGVARL